jgi:ketosteroid isomerase-like protein
MVNKNMAIAQGYYTAMAGKDAAGLEQYLHPAVHFVSPLAELHGKEDVFAAVKGFMGAFQSLTIRASFASETQAMLAIDTLFPAPIGNLRTASLVTIQDGLITKIELFYDGKQLERKSAEIFGD